MKKTRKSKDHDLAENFVVSLIIKTKNPKHVKELKGLIDVLNKIEKSNHKVTVRKPKKRKARK